MSKTIISVINQKGGTGKTTTAVNLSSGLALQHRRALLIDLDPQAHSTLALGFNPDSYKAAIHDVLLKQKNALDIILQTKVENLSLIPSHIRLDRAEQQLTPEMFRESRLHKAIKGLNHDFIIIDCRPTLGTLTINALYASNFILVPCEMSRYSLDGFSDLMETIDHVKNHEERDKEQYIRILLTKYDSRKSITNDWILEQLKPFKPLLFQTRIRQNEALNQAHIAQEPIFTFKSTSSGAQDYEALTKELLKLCHPPERS